VVDVSVGELYANIQAGETLAVVDVRESNETDGGIIAGALLYPWNSGVLEASHTDLPDDRALFVICQGGTRSAFASSFLHDNGHDCVHNVLGGMTAWTNASYPTVPP
jgi:rhodanese-related sulfurtransferase